MSSADNTSRRADTNEDHGARPFFDRPRNNWVALRVSNSDSLDEGATRARRSSRRRDAAPERPLAETLDRRAKAALSSWLEKHKDGPLTRQSLIEALSPHETGSKEAAPAAFMYVLGQVKTIAGWGPQDRFALEHLAAAALLSHENVHQTFTPWESIERGLKAFDDAYAVSGARYSTELREASPVSVKELGKRIGTWLQETSLDGDKKLFWPMELVDALVVARDEDVLDSGAAELVGKLNAALSDRDMFGKSFLTITPSALVTALKAGGVEAELSYDAVTIAGVTSKLPKPDHHDRLRRVGVTEEGRRLRYGYSER